MRLSKPVRCIIMLTVVLFSWTTILSAAPPVVYSVDISSQHGKVKSRWTGTQIKAKQNVDIRKNDCNDVSRKNQRDCILPPQTQNIQAPVIVIQDAHASLDSQNNISHILSEVQEAYGVQTVGIEGAQTEVFVEDFRAFENKALLRKTMQKLLVRGEINGATFQAITTDQPVDLVGVEDVDLYRENYEAYRHVSDLVRTFQLELGVLKNARDQSVVNLTGQGIELTELRDSYLDGNGDFSVYLEKVLMHFNAEESANFPYVALFQEALIMRSEVSSDVVYQQAHKLASELSMTIEICEANYVYIEKQALAAQIGIEEYQDFFRYAQYKKKMGLIDWEVMLQEVEALHYKILALGARSSQEKEIVSALRTFEHFNSIIQLRALRHTVDLFFSGKELTRLESMLSVFEYSELSSGFVSHIVSACNQFYAKANQRDSAMVAKLLDQDRGFGGLDSIDAKGTFNCSVAQQKKQVPKVLVAGGYHTSGIVRQLRDKNVPYIVVTPNITADTTQQLPYDNLMLGRISSIESFVSTLANPNFLSLIDQVVCNYDEKDLPSLEKEFRNRAYALLANESVRFKDYEFQTRLALTSFFRALVGGLSLDRVDMLDHLLHVESNEERLKRLHVFVKQLFEPQRYENYVNQYAARFKTKNLHRGDVDEIRDTHAAIDAAAKGGRMYAVGVDDVERLRDLTPEELEELIVSYVDMSDGHDSDFARDSVSSYLRNARYREELIVGFEFMRNSLSDEFLQIVDKPVRFVLVREKHKRPTFMFKTLIDNVLAHTGAGHKTKTPYVSIYVGLNVLDFAMKEKRHDDFMAIVKHEVADFLANEHTEVSPQVDSFYDDFLASWKTILDKEDKEHIKSFYEPTGPLGNELSTEPTEAFVSNPNFAKLESISEYGGLSGKFARNGDVEVIFGISMEKNVHISDGLYYGPYAVFPVMFEREGEKVNQQTVNMSKLGERAHQSVFMVSVNPEFSVMRTSAFSYKSNAGDIADWERRMFREASASADIPLEQIDYILAPQQIAEDVQKLFPQNEVRGVKSVRRTLYVDEGKFTVEMADFSTYTVQVPDYQSELEKILTENPNASLFGTGIRLNAVINDRRDNESGADIMKRVSADFIYEAHKYFFAAELYQTQKLEKRFIDEVDRFSLERLYDYFVEESIVTDLAQVPFRELFVYVHDPANVGLVYDAMDRFNKEALIKWQAEDSDGFKRMLKEKANDFTVPYVCLSSVFGRPFIADRDSEEKKKYQELITRLKAIVPDVDIIPTHENLHLTLVPLIVRRLQDGESYAEIAEAFLDKLGDSQEFLASLNKVIMSSNPFEIEIKGLALHPDGSLTLKAFLSDGTLPKLRTDIRNQGLESYMKYADFPRIYHVTIGRIDGPIDEATIDRLNQELGSFEIGKVHVDTVSLYVNTQRAGKFFAGNDLHLKLGEDNSALLAQSFLVRDDAVDVVVRSLEQMNAFYSTDTTQTDDVVKGQEIFGALRYDTLIAALKNIEGSYPSGVIQHVVKDIDLIVHERISFKDLHDFFPDDPQNSDNRLVVTGAPYSGKTTFIEKTPQLFGDAVVAIPEIVGLLKDEGINLITYSRDDEYAVQRTLYVLRYLLEIEAANLNPGKMVLLDRGTVDAAAYMMGTQAEFEDNVFVLDEERNRYGHVVQLQSVATSNDAQGEFGNRVEDVSGAQALESQIAHVWSDHSAYRFIEHTDWEKKESEVVDYCEQVVFSDDRNAGQDEVLRERVAHYPDLTNEVDARLILFGGEDAHKRMIMRSVLKPQPAVVVLKDQHILDHEFGVGGEIEYHLKNGLENNNTLIVLVHARTQATFEKKRSEIRKYLSANGVSLIAQRNIGFQRFAGKVLDDVIDYQKKACMIDAYEQITVVMDERYRTSRPVNQIAYDPFVPEIITLAFHLAKKKGGLDVALYDSLISTNGMYVVQEAIRAKLREFALSRQIQTAA